MTTTGTAGIASIALFAPMIASNAVFSARRANRGISSMEENPLFGIANLDLAAGQILKGARAAKAIMVALDPTTDISTRGAKELIKGSTLAGKALKGVGKVVSFTADNINPIIIGTGAIKVLGSDDKADTLARETTALTCMFGAEAAAKSFIGMPIIEKIDGKTVARHREGSYKNLMKKIFTDKQNNAINEFIKIKKNAKYVAGGVKGLLFVGASIAGYSVGNKIADTILGKKESV